MTAPGDHKEGVSAVLLIADHAVRRHFRDVVLTSALAPLLDFIEVFLLCHDVSQAVYAVRRCVFADVFVLEIRMPFEHAGVAGEVQLLELLRDHAQTIFVELVVGDSKQRWRF